jgi:hypothetical protein
MGAVSAGCRSTTRDNVAPSVRGHLGRDRDRAAADLMAGTDDPRPHAAGLLRRALTALPTPARARRIRLRADAGYFAGDLARAALSAEVEFAIGARRIAPLWRLLDGVAETDWSDAIDMANAQVAVAEYRPGWWPAATRLLIRRVRLDVSAGQVSADPRARCQRTLHPDQRALPINELAAADAVYGYSFLSDLPRRGHRRAGGRGGALVPAPDLDREHTGAGGVSVAGPSRESAQVASTAHGERIVTVLSTADYQQTIAAAGARDVLAGTGRIAQPGG